jgi:uncharacterized membrane protein
MIAEAATPIGTLAMLLLIAHVGAGCIAILAGAATLSVRKGERLHRKFGFVFFIAMLVMAAFALFLSILRQPGTIAGSIFTIYLVATARATVRRSEGTIGRFEKVAFLVAAGCAASNMIAGYVASHSPTGRYLGYPAMLYYVFGSIVTLAALGDLKMILRGGISGAPRIARHLWRMCYALFTASGSFFLGQQKVMPAFMHGSPILVVLGIAPLAFMIFWLFRVRFGNAFRNSGADRVRDRETLLPPAGAVS